MQLIKEINLKATSQSNKTTIKPESNETHKYEELAQSSKEKEIQLEINALKVERNKLVLDNLELEKSLMYKEKFNSLLDSLDFSSIEKIKQKRASLLKE